MIRSGASRRRGRLPWAALVLTVCSLAGSAPAAVADDSVYWTSYTNPGTVRFGDLGGKGNRDLFTGENSPYGIAIDAAAGKIYWAATGTGAIRVANLDGSGTPQSLFTSELSPSGVAIDPGGGKIYWTNADISGGGAGGAIRVGKLDGTGAASDLYPAEPWPGGLAIDVAGKKIYWTRYSDGLIRAGNLDGTGSPTTVFPTEAYPTGLALDPAGGKLYWSNEFAGLIRIGDVKTPPSAQNPRDLFTGETTPAGVAIDTAAGKIFWGTFSAGTIRVANLDGSGTPQSLFTGLGSTAFAALLRAPAAAGAPGIAGGGQPGQPLGCGTGTWAPDLLAGYTFRAPRTFAYEWLKDDVAIAGAGADTYTPFAAGAYRCRVTASNEAGGTKQSSTPMTVATPATGPAPGPGTDKSKAKIIVRGGFFPPPGYTRAQACRGKVFITLKLKKRRLGFKATKLNRKCRYRVVFRVARSKLGAARKVKAVVLFGGNRYLASVQRAYTVKVPRKK
jgi:hypothetical protein